MNDTMVGTMLDQLAKLKKIDRAMAPPIDYSEYSCLGEYIQARKVEHKEEPASRYYWLDELQGAEAHFKVEDTYQTFADMLDTVCAMQATSRIPVPATLAKVLSSWARWHKAASLSQYDFYRYQFGEHLEWVRRIIETGFRPPEEAPEESEASDTIADAKARLKIKLQGGK